MVGEIKKLKLELEMLREEKSGYDTALTTPHCLHPDCFVLWLLLPECFLNMLFQGAGHRITKLL